VRPNLSSLRNVFKQCIHQCQFVIIIISAFFHTVMSSASILLSLKKENILSMGFRSSVSAIYLP